MSNTTTHPTDSNLRVAGRRSSADVPRRFRDILCLDDFEEPARRFLPRPIFGYASGGVETNAARDGNRAAFAEWEFLPRVLVNTRGRHQKTTLLGRTYDLPFGFPPMGGTSLAAYMGDSVLAQRNSTRS
jgi:L-lactate dehydrogenase (cytochrome)